jgi:hypothetical protein
MLINKNEAKKSEVRIELQFLVGVRFMNKDFYLGDSFAVTKRVKEEL